MYPYLFTNDLRISSLDSSIKDAANKFLTNTIPSADEDKSANNNIKTLGFYFNLQKDSRCSKIASQGNIRKVVLNFIKKFQFPNPRTFPSYKDCHQHNIKLAPMRFILRLLYIMSINEGTTAYLTIDEITNFIFYNSEVAKADSPDLVKIYSSIKEYRRTEIMPNSIDTNLDNRQQQWKQYERQIREMIKILTWSGCVIEIDKKIQIFHSNLTQQNKSDIFEIVNYSDFWNGKYPYKDEDKDEIKQSYQDYMDISDEDNGMEETSNNGTEHKGENILIYGVPGCGKSYYINNKYTLTDTNSERVVFHPDYTYSDFVGQILPQVIENTNEKSTVEYKFIAGPFTRLLQKCKNNNGMHYLIIEEINRGNAPAIFGEIFQLLDRCENGFSEYGINNTDISQVVYKDENTKIKIPNNLTIIATMNTADQNVFVLDTAFKRRWKMKSIRNNFDDSIHCNTNLCDSNLTWKMFATKINEKIIEENLEGLISEDKRFGVYFLKCDEMQDVEMFSEKVIMYLWNDVFKFDKSKIFNTKYTTLENILDAFSDKNIKFKVFSEFLEFNIDNVNDELEDNQSDEE